MIAGWRSAAANAVLVIFSVAITLTVIEGALRFQAGLYAVEPLPVSGNFASARPANLEHRHWLLTIPDAWKKRETTVPGTIYAFYWHGVLHVLNADRFRWSKPFPPKRDDTYRIMVVGDSFTYGAGIAEESRFSNLVEHWLGDQFKIEVINLGSPGYQSEDVLAAIEKYLPVLRPNLVLYAVCLNDFLPTGMHPYPDHPAYPFPLPETVENWLVAHTRVGALVSDAYDATLRRLHLRKDFYDDILADFAGYQQRFARDVMQMNEVVRAAGLPPLLAMVLDQFPIYEGRGYRVAKIAEDCLAKAGANVIQSEPFYRTQNGRDLSVSRWEGHPNEEANWIWGGMIAQALSDRPDLAAFVRKN
jgi:GDSL-like lipase/acylhydrolase family protein